MKAITSPIGTRAPDGPIHLTVIQPGAVRLAADFFQCFRLAAKLSAIDCVKRQQVARLRHTLYGMCKKCFDGERFADAACLDPDGRDLIRDTTKALERQARAAKHAHQGQGPGDLLDDEEAA